MDATATPPATAPVPNNNALEQYKAYLQDLGNIGTRFTTMNGFYLSVITALLGILALTKAGEGLMDLKTILRLAVPLFASLICWIWSREIKFYRKIFFVKFQILRELEQYGGLFPSFAREKELFQQGAAGWLLENEVRVALFLALPFMAIFLYTFLKLFF
jgi:hypothetical protein